jgi:hypothetical protein
MAICARESLRSDSLNVCLSKLKTAALIGNAQG